MILIVYTCYNAQVVSCSYKMTFSSFTPQKAEHLWTTNWDQTRCVCVWDSRAIAQSCSAISISGLLLCTLDRMLETCTCTVQVEAEERLLKPQTGHERCRLLRRCTLGKDRLRILDKQPPPVWIFVLCHASTYSSVPAFIATTNIALVLFAFFFINNAYYIHHIGLVYSLSKLQTVERSPKVYKIHIVNIFSLHISSSL